MDAVLIYKERKFQRRQSFSATAKEVVIGRGGNIVLDAPEVSRRHAVIKKRGPIYFLTDLKSRHGTTLNRSPLQPQDEVPLSSGDQVVIGPFVLRCMFETDESTLEVLEAEPLPPVRALDELPDTVIPRGAPPEAKPRSAPKVPVHAGASAPPAAAPAAPASQPEPAVPALPRLDAPTPAVIPMPAFAAPGAPAMPPKPPARPRGPRDTDPIPAPALALPAGASPMDTVRVPAPAAAPPVPPPAAAAPVAQAVGAAKPRPANANATMPQRAAATDLIDREDDTVQGLKLPAPLPAPATPAAPPPNQASLNKATVAFVAPTAEKVETAPPAAPTAAPPGGAKPRPKGDRTQLAVAAPAPESPLTPAPGPLPGGDPDRTRMVVSPTQMVVSPPASDAPPVIGSGSSKGKPRTGTAMMEVAPGAALDLPDGAELLTVDQALDSGMFSESARDRVRRFLEARVREPQIWRRRLKKGDIAVAEGEYGKTGFYVESGRCEIQVAKGKIFGMTRRQSVAEIGPGEYFGETTSMSFDPRTASVRALDDSVVYEMRRAVLTDLLGLDAG